MNGRAPNWLCVGSQLVPVTKPTPSRLKTGHACFVVKYAIRARIASTESAAPRATARKSRSPQTSADRREPASPPAPVPPGSCGKGARAVTARTLRGDLELAQLGRRL